MELTIEFQLHNDARVLVLNHCICGEETDVRDGIEKACAFAHWAGIEVYVAVDNGPLIHYANLEFLAFVDKLLKGIK